MLSPIFFFINKRKPFEHKLLTVVYLNVQYIDLNLWCFKAKGIHLIVPNALQNICVPVTNQFKM